MSLLRHHHSEYCAVGGHGAFRKASLVEQSRRDLIKKAAVGGGLVWAAPAITSVAHVHAAAAGTPPPTTTTTSTTAPPTTCVCTGSAFALSATGLIDLGPIGSDPGTVDETEGALSIGASLLASSFDSGSCAASASVATLDVALGGTDVISATVLESMVDAPCDCSGTADSSIESLTILGADINTAVGPNTNLTIGPVLGISVEVVLNEQFCDPSGEGVVRALRISIAALGVEQEIIVAESRAGNDVCTCACCPLSFGTA